jgi:broad specificity phosphatase PhoE
MSRVQVRPTAKTRKRRRKRRALTLLAYVVIVFGLAWYFESQGTTTIIFVRHADTDQAMSQEGDAPLNAAGRARAGSLADYLERIDVVAGPNAIYVSEKKRTQQTAAPLAARLGVEPVVADHYDVVGFMKNVLFDHKREIVLIVSHSDAIAPLVEELHGSKNIAEFAPDEYDRVLIVTIPWFGKVKTLRLSYPAGNVATAYP